MSSITHVSLQIVDDVDGVSLKNNCQLCLEPLEDPKFPPNISNLSQRRLYLAHFPTSDSAILNPSEKYTHAIHIICYLGWAESQLKSKGNLSCLNCNLPALPLTQTIKEVAHRELLVACNPAYFIHQSPLMLCMQAAEDQAKGEAPVLKFLKDNSIEMWERKAAFLFAAKAGWKQVITALQQGGPIPDNFIQAANKLHPHSKMDWGLPDRHQTSERPRVFHF